MGTDFTPIASFAGGLLIGAAAVLLMLVQGRILGATGILRNAILPTSRAEFCWRAAMLAGMVSAPAVYYLLTGQMPVVEVPVSTPMLVIGGALSPRRDRATATHPNLDHFTQLTSGLTLGGHHQSVSVQQVVYFQI